MSEQATQQAASRASEHHDEGHEHGPSHYIKIWGILIVLLMISVLGPFLEIKVITLLTAFGIAVVKASMVIKYFMHIDLQPKYVAYFLGIALAFMAMFFFGVAPDVLNHEGQNWVNLAAEESIDRAMIAQLAEVDSEIREADEDDRADLQAHREHIVRTMAERGIEVAGVGGAFDPAAAFTATCSACHGTGGGGDGAAAAALDPHPANFTDPGFWASTEVERDHEHIVTTIRDGGAAVGRSPLMAAFGGQFSEEELEALATYVEAFNPEAE